MMIYLIFFICLRTGDVLLCFSPQAGMICYICSPILLAIIFAPVLNWLDKRWAFVFTFTLRPLFCRISIFSRLSSHLWEKARLIKFCAPTFNVQRWGSGESKQKENYTGPPPSYNDLEGGLPDYQAATRFTAYFHIIHDFQN